MVTLRLNNGLEFEGSAEELAEIAGRLEQLTLKRTTGTANHGDVTWRWNDDAVDTVIDQSYGKALEILQVFGKHGRELKYSDLCRLTGLRGLQLVGPLSAIRKKAKKAIGHDKAKLIEKRWVIPGNRDERIYSIHSDAYERLRERLKKP
jgi:hypothetical protein